MTTPRTLLWQPDLPARRGPRYQAIVAAIADDVTAGRLHPGDRLPTQRRLAAALGLGLGTVTRAYKEAEQRGLLASRVGRGTVVARPAVGNPLGLPSTQLIEMSVDLPLYAADPDLGAVLMKIARRDGVQQLLRYQPHAGSGRHRRAGAAWVERFDLVVRPDDVVACAGTHHALTVALMTVAQPGDVVLCDELGYPGLRALATSLHLRLHGIAEAAGGGGIDLAVVSSACRRQRVRAVYVVPSCHNPTTRQMAIDARRELARLAAKHDLFVLEDDVHRLSCVAPPRPIAAEARDRTFYVASFSKAVAAGLRVAFLVPPPALLQRSTEAVWASVWMAPPLAAEVAASWIEDGTADSVVRRKRDEAGARRQLLAQQLVGHRFEAQPSSFYAWLHLPLPWSGVEFALDARRRGVAVTPSTAFVVGQSAAPAAVRICFAAPESRADAERGLALLRQLLADGPSRRGASPAPV